MTAREFGRLVAGFAVFAVLFVAAGVVPELLA